MKTLLLFFQCCLLTIIAKSQPDNSFAATYKVANPTIHYRFDSVNQIHDYSNNWDLDNDGKPDQVYFIGTGGAHLYFYLRVILSSDHQTKNFPFLQSDMPILPPNKELQQINYSPNIHSTQFAVFGKHTKTLFIKLDDQSFYTEKQTLRKLGITTKYILLSFKNGTAVFKDYHQKH